MSRHGLSRRNFVKLNSAAAGFLAFWGPAAPVLAGEQRRQFEVLRPQDHFVAQIELVNCICSSGPARRLRRLSLADPAYILIKLPPQHMAEEAGALERPSNDPHEFVESVALCGVSQLRMAGPSLLVWELGAADFDKDDIAFDLASILRKVAAARLVVRPAGSQQPLERETSIEWPYRVKLAPWDNGRFFHLGQAQSVRHPYNGFSWSWEELWHTGLDLRRPADANQATPPVLSLSQPPRPDLNSRAELAEAPVSIKDDPRGALQLLEVRPASDEDLIFPPPSKELDNLRQQLAQDHNGVLRARQMILTSLGASGDVEYRAELNRPGGLRIWDQRTCIGRDNFIRVVTNGYLLPFQHEAVFVQIWERKLARTKEPGSEVSVENQPTAAVILKRQFIVVIKPERDIPADDTSGHPLADRLAREQGFAWVKIKEERTPNLETGAVRSPYIFWPIPLGNPADAPFQFNCLGRDRGGRLVEFTQAFLYAEDLDLGAAKYDEAPGRHRTAYLRQQPMSLVAESPVPLTAADINPQSLKWLTQLASDAAANGPAAGLMGGGNAMFAALAGILE